MAEQASINRRALLAAAVLKGLDRDSLKAILVDTSTEEARVTFGRTLSTRLEELMGSTVYTLSPEDIADIVIRIRNGAELRLK